jgi:hypothetical protein
MHGHLHMHHRHPPYVEQPRHPEYKSFLQSGPKFEQPPAYLQYHQHHHLHSHHQQQNQQRVEHHYNLNRERLPREHEDHPQRPQDLPFPAAKDQLNAEKQKAELQNAHIEPKQYTKLYPEDYAPDQRVNKAAPNILQHEPSTETTVDTLCRNIDAPVCVSWPNATRNNFAATFPDAKCRFLALPQFFRTSPTAGMFASPGGLGIEILPPNDLLNKNLTNFERFIKKCFSSIMFNIINF